LSKPDRMSMLDRKHGALSIRGQCTLLGLARSGIYRAKPAANDNDLAMMRRLDELFVAPIRFSARGGWQRCCGRKAGRSTANGSSA
jgi:putative transposase